MSVAGFEAAVDIAYAMDGMAPRHRAVIALRWAGDGGDPMRLTDVGNLLGICAERVRRMEVQALGYMARRLGLSWPWSEWHLAMANRPGDRRSSPGLR